MAPLTVIQASNVAGIFEISVKRVVNFVSPCISNNVPNSCVFSCVYIEMLRLKYN